MKSVITLCILTILIAGCATQPQVEFKLGEEVLFTESDIVGINYNQKTKDCLESAELCIFEIELIPSAFAKEVLLSAAKSRDVTEEGDLIDLFGMYFENKDFHSFELPVESQSNEIEVISIDGEAIGVGKEQVKKFVAVFEN